MSWIESIELSHWIMMKDMKHVLYGMIEWWKGMMSCCQAMQVFFQRCSPAGLHESLAPVWCIGNSFVPSSFFLLLERKGQEIMEVLMTLCRHLDLQRIWMSTAVGSNLRCVMWNPARSPLARHLLEASAHMKSKIPQNVWNNVEHLYRKSFFHQLSIASELQNEFVRCNSPRLATLHRPASSTGSTHLP